MGAEKATAQQAPPTMSPNDYVRVLGKHPWLIGAVFAASVVVFGIWGYRATPIYRAESRLHVYQRSPRLVPIEEVLPIDPSVKQYHQTQVEIIRSRSVARAVIEKLHLIEDGRFAAARDPVESFRRGIEVRPKKNTGIIEVAYRGEDREKITVWVNEIVEEYLGYHARLRRTPTTEAEQILNRRIPELEANLSESEKAMTEFHRRENIVTFEAEHASLLEKMRQLDLKLADTQQEVAELATAWEAIEKQRDGEGELQALPAIRKNETIQNLRVLEREASEALTEAKTRYIDSEKSRQLEPYKTRLQEIRESLDREVEITIEAVRAEYLQKVGEEEKLTVLIEQSKKEAQKLEEKTTAYEALKADVERNRRIYEEVALRAKEMESAAGLDLNTVTILDKAEVPAVPIWPRKRLLLFLGMVVGAVGGIGLAFLIEYMDESIRTGEEVGASLRLPLLGYVPRIDGKGGDLASRDLISHREPKSTISEFFRTIRTGLLYSHPDGKVKSLVVTSAGPKEGKTTNAINLAITMAAGGSRILLVDGDLRRSRIHQAFEVDNTRGLSTVLGGKAAFDEVVQETGVENLQLVTSGPIPPNPAEMLGNPRMVEFLEEASGRFDRVIIDTPPVVVVTDACILASIADGVIQVVCFARTSRKILERGKEQLSAVGARILGVILNNVRLKKAGYGYYKEYYKHSH